MTNKSKRTYEAMFLVDAAVAAADKDGVISTINKMMDRVKAEVISLREWDERRLCYEIKGCKRGMYILSYFRARPEVISQLERQVRLDETLLRVLILSAERIPQEQREAPTPAMLQATKEQADEREAQEQEEDYPADEDEIKDEDFDLADDLEGAVEADNDDIKTAADLSKFTETDLPSDTPQQPEFPADELGGADETKT